MLNQDSVVGGVKVELVGRILKLILLLRSRFDTSEWHFPDYWPGYDYPS